MNTRSTLFEDASAVYNILVGYDFSHTADLGLHYALDMAVNQNIKVHVLWTDSELADYTLTDPHLSEAIQRRAAELERRLEVVSDQRRRWGIPGRDSALILHVGRSPNPADDIIKLAQAEQVRLIVLGGNERTKLARFVFGSASEEVTRRAPCPVLIMKPINYEQRDPRKEKEEEHPSSPPSAQEEPAVTPY